MDTEQEKQLCSICGEENDEVFHRLNCNHTFHYQCLLLSFHVKKCEHILTKGKNKGNQCSKNCRLGYDYCTTHSKNK